MYEVKLVVRGLDGQETRFGYTRQLQLPFLPAVGMTFEQGTSCKLWETAEGEELSPAVEQIIYDLDEEAIVCLFTVHSRLASAFWTELRIGELGSRCAEMSYFRNHP